MHADINAEGSFNDDDHQDEYCGNTLPTVAAVQQFGRRPYLIRCVGASRIYRTRSAPFASSTDSAPRKSGRLTGGQRRMYVQTAVDAIVCHAAAPSTRDAAPGA